MPKTPLLGITEGDPAGIGPEITVQAIHNMADDRSFIPIVYGDPAIISRACSVTGLSETVRRVTSEEQIEPEPNVINVVDTGTVPHADSIEWGSVQELAGRAAIASIEAATDAALSGKTDGVVTSPINKEAIWKTGSEFLGHTEMLGSLCGTPDTDTMFVVSGLKIFFATRHMSLREAVDSIRRDLIDHEIHKALRALKVFGCNSPKLAVAALNPHAGEGGHFGTEEIEVLRPAVKSACAEGYNVVGPVPADSVFHKGVIREYDGVLSLYHDQGHIASKTLDFDGTVSVTAGLPILRTSVDHGTAFDIAGQGAASPMTMQSALHVASDFARFVPVIREEYLPSTGRN